MVVHGEPKARLVDCVVHPQTFLAAGGRLRLHGQYYITKQILPALDRLFSLLGVDVHEWFASMGRPQRLLPHKRPAFMLPTRAHPTSSWPFSFYDQKGEAGAPHLKTSPARNLKASVSSCHLGSCSSETSLRAFRRYCLLVSQCM